MLLILNVLSWRTLLSSDIFQLHLQRVQRQPDELVCRTSYARLARVIQQAAAVLGLGQIPYRTHSFRRGGATALSMAGMSFAEVMMFGRWHSERSARLYIKKAEVLVLRTRAQLSANEAAKIKRLASLGPRLFALDRLSREVPGGQVGQLA